VPGGSLALPDSIGEILMMPPYRGTGLLAVETYFSFVLASGRVQYEIGVGNPSEFNYPMRPYVGVNYPSWLSTSIGQKYDCSRWDEVQPVGGGAPADPRCWQMNPGADTTQTGRKVWPWLSPAITNIGTIPTTVMNVQVYSKTLRR